MWYLKLFVYTNYKYLEPTDIGARRWRLYHRQDSHCTSVTAFFRILLVQNGSNNIFEFFPMLQLYLRTTGVLCHLIGWWWRICAMTRVSYINCKQKLPSAGHLFYSNRIRNLPSKQLLLVTFWRNCLIYFIIDIIISSL